MMLLVSVLVAAIGLLAAIVGIRLAEQGRG